MNRIGIITKKLAIVTVFSLIALSYAAQPVEAQACGQTGKACCGNAIWGSYTCPNKSDEAVWHNRYGKPRGRLTSALPGTPSDICLCLPKDDEEREAFYACGVADADCLECVRSEGLPTALGCLPIDTAGIVKGFMTVAVLIGGAYALLCIVFSSYRIQTSRGNADKVTTAQEHIKSCILGLIFLIFAAFMMNLIGGSGILGYKLATLGSPLPTPLPTLPPVPTSTGTPGAPTPATPQPSRAPLPPGSPGSSNSIVTQKDVDNALKFFNDLKGTEVQIGGATVSCDVISKDNYTECLAALSSGVPHEALAKTVIKSNIDHFKDTKGRPDLNYLQCGSFQAALMSIVTGEVMRSEYPPGTPSKDQCMKSLSEPFWNFTYYDKNDTTPAIGDLVKWTHEPCGHLGFIVSVQSPTKFDVIHANWSEAMQEECWGCLSRSTVSTAASGSLAGYYRLE